jgi:hypothetical protein
MTTSKKWVFAVLGLAAALGAGSAMARSDVQWSVTIGAPVYPAYPEYPAYPVYGPPVYSQPAPVIVRPAYPVYAAPVYVDRAYYPRHRSHPSHWDRDGDGIPNRYDRVYNPRWDRDGDGVPNRYDRHDDRRWGR